MNLSKLYKLRFEKSESSKNNVWKILCKDFLQKYISKNDVVLDVAGGNGEFINNINAGEKIVFDLNPELEGKLCSDIKCHIASCFDIKKYIKDGSVDVIFISNFLEHLAFKDEVIELFSICKDVLKKGGKIIVMQPNIKYTKGAYWDFIDHKLPLTEKSVIEAANISDLHPIKVITRFLPYTTKSGFPQFGFLVSLYLKLLPFSGFLFGQQSLIILEK